MRLLFAMISGITSSLLIAQAVHIHNTERGTEGWPLGMAVAFGLLCIGLMQSKCHCRCRHRRNRSVEIPE
jgi:hypothetical protein